MAHSLLAQLAMHAGDFATAVGHARAALPVMRRLGASDDELQLHAALVQCAIADGRLADARHELDRMDRIDERAAVFSGVIFRRTCQAELLLAEGETAAGLRLYRESAARMRELEWPGVVRTGREPWTLFGDAMALAAHAHYAAGEADAAFGDELYRTARDGALLVFGVEDTHLDYPAAGVLLFALGAWALLHRAGPAQDALRVLALAARFAYSQASPSMRWDRIAAAAEAAGAGLLARWQEQYRDCPRPGLQLEARRAVERLAG